MGGPRRRGRDGRGFPDEGGRGFPDEGGDYGPGGEWAKEKCSGSSSSSYKLQELQDSRLFEPVENLGGRMVRGTQPVSSLRPSLTIPATGLGTSSAFNSYAK
jgi:hypothetical protein